VGTTWENIPHFKKCGTVGKMKQPWKIVPHVENCAHFKKNPLHLKKFVTLRKCATLAKVRQA